MSDSDDSSDWDDSVVCTINEYHWRSPGCKTCKKCNYPFCDNHMDIHCCDDPKGDLLKTQLYILGDTYRNDWSDFDGRLFQSEVCDIADQITDNDDAKQKLYDLGQQYREDWSWVDGREIRDELYDIANMLKY
jgi:hypothetical protein